MNKLLGLGYFFSLMVIVTGYPISASAQLASGVSDSAKAFQLLQESNKSPQDIDTKMSPFPKLTAIIRNADGSIRSMNQYEAIEYCLSQGLRLPTIRELALYAQSREAHGVRESAREGYYLIESTNANGKPDSFYYTHRGYLQPKGDLGAVAFWSSSLHPRKTHQGYLLHGYDAVIFSEDRTVFGGVAVRCVR